MSLGCFRLFKMSSKNNHPFSFRPHVYTYTGKMSKMHQTALSTLLVLQMPMLAKTKNKIGPIPYLLFMVFFKKPILHHNKIKNETFCSSSFFISLANKGCLCVVVDLLMQISHKIHRHEPPVL